MTVDYNRLYTKEFSCNCRHDACHPCRRKLESRNPALDFILMQAEDNLREISNQITNFSVTNEPSRELLSSFAEKVEIIESKVAVPIKMLYEYTATQVRPVKEYEKPLCKAIADACHGVEKWTRYLDNLQHGTKFSVISNHILTLEKEAESRTLTKVEMDILTSLGMSEAIEKQKELETKRSEESWKNAETPQMNPRTSVISNPGIKSGQNVVSMGTVAENVAKVAKRKHEEKAIMLNAVEATSDVRKELLDKVKTVGDSEKPSEEWEEVW